MTGTQRLTSLISLEQARALLLEGLVPVAASELPPAQALGCVAAAMPGLASAVPACDVAICDGWALRSNDLVGATSYSPVPLSGVPHWVEAGDPLPKGCDCVLDPDMVGQVGAMMEAVGEALPGAGIRRAGEDLAAGAAVIAPGVKIGALHLMIARACGLDKLAVRRPRVRIVNVPAVSGVLATAQLIAEAARAAGADVSSTDAAGRDAASIAHALDAPPCDLLLLIGGTGVGRTDASVEALQARGALLAHGIALAPGRTSAIGRLAGCPILALPGAPDQALAAWWTLARPALDCLAGRLICEATPRALARKISSAPGVAEIVLLKHEGTAWMPLSTGDLSLDHLARADAWLSVPGDCEGYATGTLCGAFPLHEAD